LRKALFILLLSAVVAWTGLGNNKVIFTLFSPFSSYGIILWGTGLILFLVGVVVRKMMCAIKGVQNRKKWWKTREWGLYE